MQYSGNTNKSFAAQSAAPQSLQHLQEKPHLYN